MKLIVGLGNPGQKYEGTRHNIGFTVIDLIADELKIDVNEKGFKGLYTSTRYNGEKIFLLKPATFMNLSGESVGELANFYKIDNEDILIISDDKDQACGSLKIRKKGSSGGHNGIKSIIAHLGGEDFPRLKVGIGTGTHGAVDHVLGHFTDEEWDILSPVLVNAKDAALCWVKEGADEAMSHYNRKAAKKKKNSNGESPQTKTTSIEE